jgi:ATPase
MISILDKYFDEQTMSVHLKEGASIVAKKGMPGNWQLEEIRTKTVSVLEMKKLIDALLEEVKTQDTAFIEIDKKLSKVLQIGLYRIVIVMPPLSNSYEITAARPLKKLTLAEYDISPKLEHRFAKRCEGVLIAGRPGEGKSTFAQALIEFYAHQQKIIKTIEAPRDLQVPENVTQYSLFHSSLSEIHDILLLSRPDYTVFDEVRNRDDFELFKDLRLTGIGMIGVIHGSRPIDAIQRFVGKIELGMIPEIIDTLVFIEKGKIQKVYDLKLTVKVPHGMHDDDLARPVVLVSDLESGRAEYEMYSFGEEIVVLPLHTQNDQFKKQDRFHHEEQSLGEELFPRFIRDKKGFRFVFNEADLDAVIQFEDGYTFSLSPNSSGYVKIGKKGKLPELLRRKKFRIFRAV